MGADIVIVIGAVLLGLCVGSFLNVCILRLPRDQSLLRPRSTCPNCNQPIAWRDNIPLVSWLWLHGKCRWCHKPISRQYPLIEALVGVWFGASVLAYGPTLHALFNQAKWQDLPKSYRSIVRAACNAAQSAPCGACSSSTMIVMRIAITPSLNASSLDLFMP